MAPRVLDPSGAEVYGTSQVDRDNAVKQGMVGYAKTLESARGNVRVAGTPLVVKATKLQGAGKSDIEIAAADADRVREAASKMTFLTQCRVMIVLD